MPKPAKLIKLFAACAYESLILIALWLITCGLFMWIFGIIDSAQKRFLLQLVLWLATGAYFVWCWIKSGQTVATRTWKIKLVNQQNNTLTPKQAVYRYALGSACILACGLGLVWALFDKQHIFLHDRLLKTRFIDVSTNQVDTN
jgi:uncharacterized RDD family membrane protein YckC